MSGGPSEIHLSELLSKLRSYCNQREYEFDREVIRRAAKLTLEEKSKSLSKNDKRVIQEWIDGKTTIDKTDSNRKRPNLPIRQMVMIRYGKAELQLCEEMSDQQQKERNASSVFEYAYQKMCRSSEVPFSEEQLDKYLAMVALGAMEESDDLSAEVARLHGTGLTNELLAEIWDEYSFEAQEIGLPKPEDSDPKSPEYDNERRELRWQGKTIKAFRQKAGNQELLLRSFQEQEWKSRIDDPLKPGKLRDTLKALNSKTMPIAFEGDGTGEGVIWTLKKTP